MVLDLLNFQLRDSVFVNIAFHFPVTSHWSDRSLSFSTFLAALFILITQTDLVYHQQFGLVYSRFKCLGDKLSSLVHEDAWDTVWKWPLNRHFMSRCWVVTELILIYFPSTSSGNLGLHVAERANLDCQCLSLLENLLIVFILAMAISMLTGGSLYLHTDWVEFTSVSILNCKYYFSYILPPSTILLFLSSSRHSIFPFYLFFLILGP